MTKDYISKYLQEVKNIADLIDQREINKIIERIVLLKKRGGRIFFIGVGGSASNCSHAVNDFRKIAEVEAYTPIDNVAELTARTNDEGWETVFREWLMMSKLNNKDILFVLSVGGGNEKNRISVNIINAIKYARKKKCDVVGITGKKIGYTQKNSYACVIIPSQSKNTLTPHSEAWQATIWHLIVTDPRLQSYSNKWESIDKK
tara:strand:+ start:1331 stop:1939 length:609 start_codon:yes stop_codon:yes gene_type:complete